MSLARTLMSGTAVIAGFIGLLGYQWHSYVTNTHSPYDEVGMALNGAMPPPLNKWGCDQLHATFGNVLPPLNCEAVNGSTWR